MKKSLCFLMLFALCFFSCSTTEKKIGQADEVKADSLRHDIYQCIQQIAEALPMNAKESLDFFDDLDSIKMKTPRSSQNQQFQYGTFTVFYVLPSKGGLQSVGIDLDTSSHVNMEQLGQQLETKWHSADLIEVEAGKVHYSADYIDSKKVKKEIHITIGLSHQPKEKDNEVRFINIDAQTNSASVNGKNQ
jgi:hypothetical protein